jgi:tetratricopeptide (TPR) repeat protein
MDMDRRIPADTLARAAWTYGKVSGHMALMGWARGMQSSVALWDRRYGDAVRYAEDGLGCLRVGSGAARLHMLRARSYALLGRAGEASEALLQAADVRTGADELHDEIAGEFAFRPAKEHYYAAVTHLHLSDPASAIESARRSLSLYASGEPENRSYGCESMASAHLAIAHLMEGDRQGAEDALAPILALPPDRRIGSLSTTLSTGRSLLTTRPGGEQLARQIENFCSVGLPQQARRAISDGSGR